MLKVKRAIRAYSAGHRPALYALYGSGGAHFAG